MALGFASHGAGAGAAGADPVVSIGTALDPNSVYVCAVVSVKNGTGAPLVTPVGMTDTSWTQVKSFIFRTASFSRRLGVFYTETGPSPSGTTITCSGQDASGTQTGVIVFKVTGAVPGSVVVQSKQGAADLTGTSGSITLDSALAKSSNRLVYVCANRGGGAQTPTGGGTNIMGFGETYGYYDNDTSGGASWGVSDAYGFIGLEVNALLTQAVAGSITPTGALTNVKAALLSIAGSITPTGALSTLYYKALSIAGSITPTGSLVATRIKRLLSAVGEILTLALIPLPSEDQRDLTEVDDDTSLTLTPHEEQDA